MVAIHPLVLSARTVGNSYQLGHKKRSARLLQGDAFRRKFSEMACIRYPVFHVFLSSSSFLFKTSKVHIMISFTFDPAGPLLHFIDLGWDSLVKTPFFLGSGNSMFYMFQPS